MNASTEDKCHVLRARAELLKLRSMFNRYLAGITTKDYKKCGEAIDGFEESFSALNRSLSSIEEQIEGGADASGQGMVRR